MYQVSLLVLSLLVLKSCQVKTEAPATLLNPSTQEIAKAIKDLPQYGEYITINSKIEELMPKTMINATKEQKLSYNNAISKYDKKLDMFKNKDLELLSTISDITKPLEELRSDRLSIVKSIYSSLSTKYPSLTIDKVALVLINNTKSNARLTSCSGEAYAASFMVYEYIMQSYGDISFAYLVADWTYSKTYMSCLDPIGRGEGMAMA